MSNDNIPEPGVYFDMPMAEYLKIPALSASLLKDIRISPLDAWVRNIDPNREEEQKKCFDFGTAVHSLILEGWDAFNENVAQPFVPEPGTESLRTLDHLKERCRVLGVQVTGTKSDLTNRLIATGVHTFDEFYDVQKEMHDKANIGKIELSDEQRDAIARIHDLSANCAQLRPGILQPEGKPEVTIIWYDEEFGVHCKARPDYLNPESIVSLKTFGHRSNKNVEESIPAIIAQHNYFIDAAFYIRAWDYATKMPRPEGHAMAQHCKYIFLFVRSGPVNNIIAREFAQTEGKISRTAQYGIGMQEMYRAVDLYKQYLKVFGVENPWQPICKVKALDDSDFPAWVMG